MSIALNTQRVRGMAPWQPRAATRELLDLVRGILIEYGDYLPLTLRQIFYRLVGVHDYPKTELAYDRLGEHLNRARRAGLIPWEAIRDDGATIRIRMGWSSVAGLVATWRNDVDDFRLDRQDGQPNRRLIMVEAAGMQPMLARIVAHYSIPVIPSGGFDSTTVKHDLAVALGEQDGPATEVIDIGDLDPSGVHRFASMAEDVQAFIADLELRGAARFTRLAVTPEQVETLDLPTAPPKVTDKRAFEGGTTQAEAIPPDVLARIVTDAIEARLDRRAYAAVLKREERDRDRLRALLNRLTP